MSFGPDEFTLKMRVSESPHLTDSETIFRIERRAGDAWYILAANDMTWRVPDNTLLASATLEEVQSMHDSRPRKNVIYHDDDELAFYVQTLSPATGDRHRTYVMNGVTLHLKRK